MTMPDLTLYAVFIHPAALEALGEPIKPYLNDGPYGPHVVCREIDSGGAFFEMTIEGRDSEGHLIEVELMIPSAMVRMVVSTHSDGLFGFHHSKDVDANMPTTRKTGAAAHAVTRDPPPNEPTAAPAIAASAESAIKPS
jgi:hypothetical protein